MHIKHVSLITFSYWLNELSRKWPEIVQIIKSGVCSTISYVFAVVNIQLKEN